MSRRTVAHYRLLSMAWLLLASGMAAQAQDRPRIMPSPNPDVDPSHGDVVYRETGSIQLRADLYLPESDRPTAAISTILAFALSGATPADPTERAQLGHGQLMSARHPVGGPVANNFFMPFDGAAAAHHRFSGAITVPEHAMQSQPEAILPADIAGKKTQLFPGVTFHFLSHGTYLVPVERDITAPPGSDSFWPIQVAPGDQLRLRRPFRFIRECVFE